MTSTVHISARNPDTQSGHIPVGNHPSNEFPLVPNRIFVSRQKLATAGWWQTIRRRTQKSTGLATDSPTYTSIPEGTNPKQTPLVKYNTVGWFVMHFQLRPGVYSPHTYFAQCPFINFSALRWHNYHVPGIVRHRPWSYSRVLPGQRY